MTLQVAVENGLHLLDGLELGPAPFDAEVLVEQLAMEAFDDAVDCARLTLVVRCSMSSSCRNGLIGVLVGPTAELASIVGEHGIDFSPCTSNGGMTSAFIRCTAVTGILLR